MPTHAEPVPAAPGAWVSVRRRGTETELEVHGVGADAEPEVLAGVVEVARAAAAQAIGAATTVHLAAEHPAEQLDPVPEAVADALGLIRRRDLLQLRRALPLSADDPARAGAPTVTTRSFSPDDAPAWIRANNRAFAHHPDQGAETAATLAARTAEPWFDPAGFLLVDDTDRTGELAGFCWTKVHPPTADEPRPTGEIYVIGVDPSQQGRRLGLALVLAGLDHLADRGLTTALLYVEADNDTALGLYHRLGFALHRRRRVYSS